jgi:peptidoglycan/xylan/chitin deacetylase (PgdA/CDA1 family)
VLIVTYHAVAGPSSPVCCPPAQLDADLAALANGGFTFVSLDQCADWLAGGPALPDRAVAITFDDAYASVVTDGLPILTRWRVPAAIFVIGARIGGDNRWPGQWASIPSMPLSTLRELQEAVAAGVSIGSHAWSHPVLPELDRKALQEEVVESAGRLEELLGTPVRHFAYPYGIRGAREIDAARTAYRTAVNAQPRSVGPGDNPHDLSRIDCHDLRVAIRLGLLDRAAIDPYLAVRRGLRQVRRLGERILGRS